MADGELDALRARLDEIDAALVGLLAERAAVIAGVVGYKRTRGVPVVDRRREEAMLERIGVLAAEVDLPPAVARQVLRAVIDSFTRVELEELGEGDR